MREDNDVQPWGHRWRSSKAFLVFTASMGLFSETFLYGFVVPILKYMIQVRLGINPSRTQSITTAVLSLHGLIALISAPIIAHFVDKAPSKKIPLLISLAGCFAGTLLVASTISEPALYIGRVIQATSGSAGWIASYAMLADSVEAEHMGKSLGLASSFLTAGILGGPMVGGGLLDLLGYWGAWSVPLALLAIDFIARLLMIEHRYPSTQAPSSSSNVADTISSPELDETTGLLSSANGGNQPAKSDSIGTEDKKSRNFYFIMLREIRVLASLFHIFASSIILAGFDTTLPLHLGNAFGWGSWQVGMTIFAINVPSVFLGTPVGWLRDRVGLRYPTTLGWILLAPLLWLLGVPGHHAFKWADPETNGKVIFISTIICVGIVYALLRGVATLQLTIVNNEMQAKNSNIFGKHGGSSRTFSLAEIAFNIGLMVGPLICGSLTEVFGYYYSNVTLAAISLGVALSTFFCLDSKSRSKRSDSSPGGSDPE